MKLLIFGANGQLGSSLIRNLPNSIGLTRDNVLVEDYDDVKKEIDKYNPKVVINTTAYHNVVDCENNPEKSFLINCLAVRNLAEICKNKKIDFITISTNYVFGLDQTRSTPYTEDDTPAPVSAYGLSKLAGEYEALNVHKNTIIIRTAALYGLSGAETKGGNFVDKRVLDAKKVKSLEMSSEQIINPTYTEDLAIAISELLKNPDKKYGVYHITNEGFCSWADFTKEIYRLLNIDVQIIPVDRKGIDKGVRKPIYGALENKRLKKLGITMPHWKDALRRYLKEKYKNNP